MKLFKSVGNTLIKTLGAVDDIVDGTSIATQMYKRAMEEAGLEQEVELLLNGNRIINTEGLSEAQREYISSKLPA